MICSALLGSTLPESLFIYLFSPFCAQFTLCYCQPLLNFLHFSFEVFRIVVCRVTMPLTGHRTGAAPQFAKIVFNSKKPFIWPTSTALLYVTGTVAERHCIWYRYTPYLYASCMLCIILHAQTINMTVTGARYIGRQAELDVLRTIAAVDSCIGYNSNDKWWAVLLHWIDVALAMEIFTSTDSHTRKYQVGSVVT